ncbi:MAG TPA: hypothetical protein PLH39_05920 [Promineifilum sp.]|nr:hypothetical protein [Promineifilum sp.]
MRNLLETLIDLAGVSVDVQTDAARLNPSDTPCLYGSNAKIAADTSWRPTISLRQSLADALADWEARLLAEAAPA